MAAPAPSAAQLFDRARCCLAVIDVQQHFLDKLPLDWRRPLTERIAWLVRVATALGIPVVVMAEDLPRVGPPVEAVRAALPAGTPVHDKRVFGLAGQAEILAAVRATGRPEAVLVGLETDVCVAHSAIGLLQAGLRVAVVEDATGSPPPHHAAGLARIAAAGALVTSGKGIFYEWVRDLATLAALPAELRRDLPPGITL